MEKWMNVELDRKFLVDGLTNYLELEGIKFEKSDCSTEEHFCRHFEIYCDSHTQEKIDKMLDWLAFWDVHYDDYSE